MADVEWHFWEESQRKQYLCAEANHWQPTLTLTFSLEEQLILNMVCVCVFSPCICPDASSFSITVKRERHQHCCLECDEAGEDRHIHLNT